jgi:hypothetical protein
MGCIQSNLGSYDEGGGYKMNGALTKRLSKLLFNRRAVSVVISNVLLTCAVVTLGLVVTFWAQQRAFEANEGYADTTDENIARIGERLVFEHIFYNYSESTLSVYLINCGKSDGVGLDVLRLSNNSWSQTYSEIEMKSLNGTEIQSLNVGEEGYFKLPVNLVSFYVSYFMRVTTDRGRQFATSFTA